MIKLIKDLILEQKEKNFREYFKKIFKKSYSIENNPFLQQIEQVSFSNFLIFFDFSKFFELKQNKKQNVKNHLESLILPYQHKCFESMEAYKFKHRTMTKPVSPSLQLQMKKDLLQIQDFFSESLENQLKSTEIFPETLPKLITVIFSSNKIKLNDVSLSEKESMEVFIDKLQARTSLTGEPIREIDKNSISIITIPFFHSEEVDFFMGNKENLRENLLKIERNNEYFMKKKESFKWETIDHGDVFIVFGDIKFKNDFPPECITFEFKANVVCDYFSCAECKIKCKFCF